MTEDFDFPVYRKYRDGKTFFKVTCYNEFEEMKVNGDQVTISIHTAKIHPDRVYISDMLFEHEKYWDVIAGDEYEEIKRKALSQQD